MKYTISEGNLPVLTVELNEGESVFTETGGMGWMSSNIDMNTSTRGGLIKGLTRSVAGESLFMTSYSCQAGTGIVTFCPELPGRIVPMELAQNEAIICQRDVFMAGTEGLDVKVEFTRRLGAGFFGGEGFILQKLTGPGTAFLEMTGEIIQYNLEAGQTLKVDPGYIAAFDPGVTYDINRVKGVKNMLFGGEGLFLASVTGPGRVWLQSMPITNLAAKLSRYIPTK